MMQGTYRLSTRASNVQFLLRQYRWGDVVPFDVAKYILENVHCLCQSEEYYNLALAAICRIADQKPEDPFLQQLLYDCIVESRIYLYREMLSTDTDYFENCSTDSIFDQFAREPYTLPTNTILTKPQKLLVDAFKRKRRLVVSAPTSFGKSRIIPELIASYRYRNSAVVVPTNALLHETYTSLLHNPNLAEYKLITSRNQKLSKQNIFVLTPERMDLLLDEQEQLSIDFFAMDEIYKIDNDDDRSLVFANCLRRLLKSKSDFYLIGPYFGGFSRRFLVNHEADFVKFDQEIVQKESIYLPEVQAGEIIALDRGHFKLGKGRDTNLKNIVRSLKSQSLVYVKNKRTAESKARLISEASDYSLRSDYIADLIDFIKEHVSDEWSLINFLKKGVAFHHAGLPKFIATEITEAYNEGKIRVIVCSTTLTEGVNTTAKNVIIYDNEKGSEPLTGFDVKNIKGRAGRLGKHFTGRVLSLVELPADEELSTIPYSFLDKDLLSSEELVLLDDEDDHSKPQEKQRMLLMDELTALEIDLGAIRQNKYISVRKQVEFILHLRNNPEIVDEIYFEYNIPNKIQLEIIIGLCFDHLFSEKDKGRESSRAITRGRLVNFSKKYIYFNPSLKQLISEHQAKSPDARVRGVFNYIYNYFEFALPRSLNAFQNLYNYTSPRKIDLTHLIKMFEYGSSNEQDIALREAGVPQPIIRKISSQFRGCKDIDEIRGRFRSSSQVSSVLSPFEMRILKRFM